MASGIRARFRGVKESPLLTKPKKVDQVWDAIFGGTYKMPKCPDCGEPLYFMSMEMSISAAFHAPLKARSSHLQSGSHGIEIVLECRKCILTVNGYAEGLDLKENGDFTLERIIPIDIQRETNVI